MECAEREGLEPGKIDFSAVANCLEGSYLREQGIRYVDNPDFTRF